ncbi:MAG: FtsX-like permease family protein [Candidatus Latescibacteria bacterium]|nr:FtsX-like permease family protein [Candidatus Latescibacterota bacterium]
MSRVVNIGLLALALGMIAAVGIFDPVAINQRVSALMGWAPQPPVKARLVPQEEADQIRLLAEAISAGEVAAEIERLSSFGSRVTGYPGAQQAGDYLLRRFEELRLQGIRVEDFEVPVPVDKGAELEIEGGGRARLYCLWPNGVRTPSLPEEGVEGALIYGGKGSMAELDGKRVQGSVVLLDFDCGQDYLNAAALGARALVFTERGEVSRQQAADKFLKVSVDVPRFWIRKEGAQELLAALEQREVRVRLKARMDWETAQGRNVYGWLPGLDEALPAKSRETPQRWKDQTIVIEAYYDAISVVPALAPGAENAAGIAALLQLAKILQEHRPRYSVLFLATAGHFEGLAGVNDFLYRHSRRSEYFHERMSPSERIDFDLMLSLDLSSHHHRSATFGMGTFYNPKWTTDNYLKYMLTPYSQRLSLAVDEIFADTSRHVEGVAPSKRIWKNYMPIPLAFDSEAAAFAGQKALAVATPNDARQWVDTPLDLPERMDLANLERQVETIAGMVLWASRDPDLLKPTKLELEDYGHSMKGTIYWFDRDVNFAVPKAPVSQALVTYQQLGPNSVAGVRTLMVERADDQGRFLFDIMRNRYSNTIKAYQLGPGGEITSAPDMGQEGKETYPVEQPWGWWENEMLQVVFKCRALSLFEIVDSRYLSVLDHLTVLDERDGVPQSWGADFVESQSNEEGKITLASVVYAKPGARVKALMSTSLFGVRYLLSNAPEEWVDRPPAPEEVDEARVKQAYGRGYPVEEGRVLQPAYAAARDMWVLNDARLKQLARYGVRNENFLRLHDRARQALGQARAHFAERQYSAFAASARQAWGLASRGYPDIKSMADDTVYGVIFYFALLLPFSFFCERLFAGSGDVRRQVLGAAGFFVGIFLIMRLIHPAFKLSSSPYIIFLAFVIFAIGGTALAMVLGRFTRGVAQQKRAASGVHEADIGRLSATAAAISLGVSNLRKRKLRTLLTVTTLTLLTFTAQAFTSVQSYLKFYQIPRANTPSYEGALLRDRGWKGLQLSVLDYVYSAFGGRAQVAPRSWYIAQFIGDRAYIDVDRGQAASYAFGLLGLTPEEREVMGIDHFLVGGASRWFQPGEQQVCILPEVMAQILGIGDGEIGRAQVELMGQRYTVIGVIAGEAVDRLRDLDNESLMPVDTVAEAQKMQDMANLDPRLMDTAAIESFAHLLASNTVILPYQRVIDLNGTLRSIAICGFAEGQSLVHSIEEFVSRVAMPVFVGQGDKTRVYTSMGSASFSGIGNLIVPLLIAALIVLNTMMGSVYERDREIGVYSSVGLAPNHIAALFIAESLVFAIVGAVLGYLVGQSLTLLMVRFGWLGGMSTNYSSLSAISSTFIVMATVVLSTLYPARRAADMSVPDVTRRWTFPEPEGDEWRFDFPFTIGRSDALGVCSYLRRVFAAYGEGSVGDFMTEGVEFKVAGSGGDPVYGLELMAWLAPYDLGVSQRVELRTLPTEDIPGIYRIEMELRRISGDVASWRRLNSGFLNVLRKRFLVWRTIDPATRAEYLEEGRRMVEEQLIHRS